MNALDFLILKNNSWTLINPPYNWQELMLELSFENNSPSSVINASKLIWKAENADFINEWIKGGLTNSVGIFEGIPLRIRICGTQELVFDGIIDLTDPESKFTCDIIECKIRDNRMDMVSQLMDSISFAFLATPTSKGGAGIIKPSPINYGGDYVVIPYQRSDIPDYLAFFTTALTVYNIAQIIADVYHNLVALVDAAIAAYSSGSTMSMIIEILKIIAYILYLAALLYMLYQLLKAAFNYLVGPVLSKFGMYAKTLFERACQYFNIGFSSTIFNNTAFNKLVVMPSKSAWAINLTLVSSMMTGVDGGSTINNRMQYDDLYNWQNGGYAYGYYDGTCGDFIRSMEDVFNAKAKIILNNQGQPVLHFERWDYLYNQSNYQLPNISDQVPFNSQGLFNTTGFSQSGFKTNASEIYSNYYVKYALDDNEYNTYEFYDGNVCYCTNVPIVVNTRNNVTLQNIKEVNLKYAHAHRKNNLTAVEEALIPIWDAASYLTNFAIEIIDPVNEVYNYILGWFDMDPLPTTGNGGISYMPSMPPWANTGHLLLSNNTTGVPKIFIAGDNVTINNYYDFQSHTISGVNINSNNKGICGARYLMKNFHFSNLPQTVYPGSPYSVQASNTPYFNQWLIYDDQDVPICCEEYNLIKNNNIIKTYINQYGRVNSLRWNLYKGTATIDYRINVPYTKNIKTSFIIDGAITTQQL